MNRFYGDLHTPTTSLQFDKIYPNKKAMMDSFNYGQDDGVLPGRYVLVEYDQGQGYDANYAIDKNNDGINYDSTVWLKTFGLSAGAKLTYIMVAALNGIQQPILVKIKTEGSDITIEKDERTGQYTICLPAELDQIKIELNDIEPEPNQFIKNIEEENKYIFYLKYLENMKTNIKNNQDVLETITNYKLINSVDINAWWKSETGKVIESAEKHLFGTEDEDKNS